MILLRHLGQSSRRRWYSSSKNARATLGGFDILSSVDPGETRVIVRGYGDHAFQINDVLVQQSVILLPKSFYLWNAKTFSDITIESLALFQVLYPTLEVLFVGCGEHLPGLLPAEVTSYFKSKGIVIEQSNSANAAASFNFLNAEGRNVAAALLTLQPPPIQT